MSLTGRSQWQRPKPDPILVNFERRCRAAKEQPFLDEKLMEETVAVCDPACRGTLLTTKFWDNRPPEGTQYWAAQRECQNAALLAMMRYVIENVSEPIWLRPTPKTQRDAALNLYAFSDEGRQRQLFRRTPGAVEYSTVPHMRKCHGWMMISGKEIWALPRVLTPPETRLRDGTMRQILLSEDYYAILYEYVPDSDHGLDFEVIQAQLDFFWLTGFCMVPLRKDNWKGAGILVDMADLVCPWQAEWFTSFYNRKIATGMIETPVQDTPPKATAPTV